MATEQLESKTDAPPEELSSLGWFWMRIVRPLGVAYLMAILFLMLAENTLLFPGPVYPEGNWTHGAEIEDVEFTSADGTKLHGWYYHVENPRAVVLLFHGNAENITNSVGLMQYLAREYKIASMAFDYRGYGRSSGSPYADGIVADGRAARAWLAQRAGVAENRIVLWGRSLGGGVATDLAADGARGLILQSTFTSMPDVAAHHVRWVPVHWIMRTRLNSLEKIGHYAGPLLMCHSHDDEVIPFEQGQRLYEAAKGKKLFVEYKGVGHNGEPPQEFLEELAKFLEGLD